MQSYSYGTEVNRYSILLYVLYILHSIIVHIMRYLSCLRFCLGICGVINLYNLCKAQVFLDGIIQSKRLSSVDLKIQKKVEKY